MKDHRQSTFQLLQTCVHLTDGYAATRLTVDESFWQTIDRNPALLEGRLAGVSRMTGDWSHWEMHPAGDEVLLLLSGSMGLVLQEAAGDRIVELEAGSAFIVPRGIWHRGLVRRPGDLLFITRGAGTQHRPAP